ncbi:MAG: hypothetical protein ACYC5O_24320 [Anaerolineae bacterium]
MPIRVLEVRAMVLAVILRQNTALEDPWVRENFYEMGMGWVDGNAYISTTVPDDLEDMLLERDWGELVDVEVLSDEEALEFSGADADFAQDPVDAARAVSESFDGDGREWAHYGVYGTPDSTWMVVPEVSPVSGTPRIEEEEADEDEPDDLAEY